MASSSITLRTLRRLPRSTVVPRASSCRYYNTTIDSHRDTDAGCIVEYPGPVDHFVVNPLRSALYSFMDTIYPYTPTKNLRWSLNTMDDFQSRGPRSLLADIKSSLLPGGRWDVTETAKTLRIFRDMRGLGQDIKVWVEEGTEHMELGEVCVENGNFVRHEGPKVFGQLLERDVYGTVRLSGVFLNPSVTPFMKPEELKRSKIMDEINTIFGKERRGEYGYYGIRIIYPEMPYPSVSLFIKLERQKGYEGKDLCEPYTVRIGLPGNVYKTNDIKIEVKNELLKVIVPKMNVKRVSNLKCTLESGPSNR